MRARFVFGVAGIGGLVLVLAVMCVVVAQGPARTKAPKVVEVPPGTRIIVPASPPTIATADAPPRIAPPSTLPAADFTPSALTPPAPARPAVVELTSGIKLAGKLAADPIPFLVMFGEASLPLETIRGIRISDQVPSNGGPPQLISATIILANGDSLTGMPRLDVIRLETEWGEAIVKMTHLKSVVVMGDDVVWEQHEGRWRLIPVLPTTEAAEDNAAAPRDEPASLDATGIPPPIIPRTSQPAPPADAESSPPNTTPLFDSPKR